MSSGVEVIPMGTMDNKGFGGYLSPVGDEAGRNGNGGTKAWKRQKNDKFDSGVGDLEGVRIEGLQPGVKPDYDYADCGHQYEELPGGRKSTLKFPMDSGGDSRPEYQSSGGATDIVSETDDTAVIVNQSEKRKRVNPLYDAMTTSMPSIYNKGQKSGEKRLQRQVTFLKCLVLVLLVVCCASLAVSIYTTLSSQAKPADTSADLRPAVEKLTANYTNLEKWFSQLQQLLYTNSSKDILTVLVENVQSLENKTSAELEQLAARLTNTTAETEARMNRLDMAQQNITSQLATFKSFVQQELDTISKMPGPQGPQGVGNLSLCYYDNRTNNSPASEFIPSETAWGPSVEALETNVVMFAACSVKGGEDSQLERKIYGPNRLQYKCQCTGAVESADNRRYCYLHLWLCPRES